MQICTQCNTTSSDSASQCKNCQADLSEWSATAVAQKNFLANPRVRFIRIVVTDDCCPACREMHGAYAKDNVPALPVTACSHPLGCRCFYQPFLDEIYP